MSKQRLIIQLVARLYLTQGINISPVLSPKPKLNTRLCHFGGCSSSSKEKISFLFNAAENSAPTLKAQYMEVGTSGVSISAGHSLTLGCHFRSLVSSSSGQRNRVLLPMTLGRPVSPACCEGVWDIPLKEPGCNCLQFCCFPNHSGWNFED